MPTRCQILLPGLFDLPFTELTPGLIERQLPSLNRLLRYATAIDNRSHTIDASIAAALEWPGNAQHGLPLAQAFAGDSEHDHLLVEAVHLHPDLHNAILIPIEKNQRSIEDINILINDLNDLFKVDCHLTAIHETTYLMRLETLAAPAFYPHLLSVLGKPANPYVEQSRQDLPWYRLLNEFQMFLHQHPVNQQRQSQGLLAINSLWCWGGGTVLTSTPACAWYCDDLILNRFATWTGLSPKPVDRLKAETGDRQAVIVDLRLLEATKTGQDAELNELLLDIEARIFAPSLDLFGESVRLRSGCELDFQMHPANTWKFWRRQRNLDDCQQLLHSRVDQYS